MSKWNPSTKQPKKAGWYLRDYRNTKCKQCPPFIVDLWQPIDDPDLSPGVWYVYDEGGNEDASYQELPWKKIKGN